MLFTFIKYLFKTELKILFQVSGGRNNRDCVTPPITVGYSIYTAMSFNIIDIFTT